VSYAGQMASLDGAIMDAAEAMIPVTDEGLVRGDGVFEVIALYGGRPFAFEEHLARLERSARNLRLPVDVEAVRAESHRLIAAANGTGSHEALRIMVTRGGRRVIFTERFAPSPERLRLASVTYEPTLVLDGVKSLSYAANMLANRIARERGFDEAVFVTADGLVLELPTRSILWVQDGELLTPPLTDHILASITRAQILELTDARERSCTLEQLKRADEVMVAGTSRELVDIAAVDDREFPRPGPVFERTAAKLQEFIAAEVARA
jgi:branched-chain amino acid aminotransferase